MVVHQNFAALSDKSYSKSGSFISETVNNMRTVASFGNEDTVLKNYEKTLDEPMRLAVRRGTYSGLALGLSQAIQFL